MMEERATGHCPVTLWQLFGVVVERLVSGARLHSEREREL